MLEQNIKIDAFADLLEKAGYKGALDFVNNELLPLSTKMGTSLVDAAFHYNRDGIPNAGWWPLSVAINAIDPFVLEEHDVYTPFSSEQADEAWRRLCNSNLKGYTVNSGNPGGDMWELNAVVDDIFPVLGVGVMIKLFDVLIKPQCEDDPFIGGIEYKHETLIGIFDNEGYPSFNPYLGTESTIVIDSGIMSFVIPDENEPPFSFDGFGTVFIFPPP